MIELTIDSEHHLESGMLQGTPPVWWPHSLQSWLTLCRVLNQQSIPNLAAVKNEQSWLGLPSQNNHNYQLKLDSTSFFVQIPDERSLAKLPARQFVPTNQVIAKNGQLTPWLVNCIHESCSLRLFDWVEVEQTLKITSENDSIIRLLAHFLNDLHNSVMMLPLLDIGEHLEHYYLLAVGRKLRSEVEIEQLYRQAAEYTRFFVPSKSCHNDLSPDNVLLTKTKQLKVIDWEYACLGDPVFDLAGVSVMFQLNHVQEQALLEEYAELSHMVITPEKYQSLKKLYQLLQELWLIA